MIEQALRQYEYKREEIYKELEIAFIQERVKNRLMRKENKNVEILFYRKKESEELELEDLLSTDENNIEIDENSAIEIGDNSIIEKEDENSIVNKYKSGNHLSSFLDLEADYSGSSEGDDEEDGDLSDIIDDSVEDEINLDCFMKEKAERDEKILRDLKRRYSRKDRRLFERSLEVVESQSEENFPEIKEFQIEEEEENKIEDINNEFIGVTSFNKRIKIEQDEDLFEDVENTIEKMNKKEEKKNLGFIEKSR